MKIGFEMATLIDEGCKCETAEGTGLGADEVAIGGRALAWSRGLRIGKGLGVDI